VGRLFFAADIAYALQDRVFSALLDALQEHEDERDLFARLGTPSEQDAWGLYGRLNDG
jgi:hypothetical protein